jgi:hypothetical protein
MGYSVWLECPTCEEHSESWSYTYNISGMLRDDSVRINIDKWAGQNAAYVVPELEKGIRSLEANPEHFEKMNPENGWGSYLGLLNDFLKPMLLAFRRAPESIIGTWL